MQLKQNKWPALSKFKYPGRFLILGRTAQNYYAIYGVTARSEPGRAKIYVFDRATNRIKVEPTNAEIIAQGNLDLLSYNAVHIFKNSVILGNGKQTDLIKLSNSAVESLASGLNTQTFEPDKYNTPRITAMLCNNEGNVSAAMYLIKAGDEGDTQHEAYDLDLEPNQAYFISTYSGENIKPTPSFNSDPILLKIDFKSVEEAAQQVYNYFAPTEGEKDLRVSVIAIEADSKLEEKGVAVINYAK